MGEERGWNGKGDDGGSLDSLTSVSKTKNSVRKTQSGVAQYVTILWLRETIQEKTAIPEP